MFIIQIDFIVISGGKDTPYIYHRQSPKWGFLIIISYPGHQTDAADKPYPISEPFLPDRCST